MLVLGRKPGEYVVIGSNIKVKVVKSDNGDLRLAIDAPRNVEITRGEVWEQQQKFRQAKWNNKVQRTNNKKWRFSALAENQPNLIL